MQDLLFLPMKYCGKYKTHLLLSPDGSGNPFCPFLGRDKKIVTTAGKWIPETNQAIRSKILKYEFSPAAT